MKRTNKYTLSHIPLLTTVDQLWYYYNDLLEYTKQRITNKEIAYDYTHDAIIRLKRYIEEGKQINSSYIESTLWSEYYRELKKTKNTFQYDEFDIIDRIDIYSNVETNLITNELYKNKYEPLHWYEKEVLKYCMQMPLAQLAKETNISYFSLRTTVINISIKLDIPYKILMKKLRYNKKND